MNDLKSDLWSFAACLGIVLIYWGIFASVSYLGFMEFFLLLGFICISGGIDVDSKIFEKIDVQTEK